MYLFKKSKGLTAQNFVNQVQSNNTPPKVCNPIVTLKNFYTGLPARFIYTSRRPRRSKSIYKKKGELRAGLFTFCGRPMYNKPRVRARVRTCVRVCAYTRARTCVRACARFL